jgi:hypothetical protein
MAKQHEYDETIGCTTNPTVPPLCRMILGQINDRLDLFETKLSNGFNKELQEHALQIQSLREAAARSRKLVSVVQTAVIGMLVVGGFALILHLGHQYLDAQEARIREDFYSHEQEVRP